MDNEFNQHDDLAELPDDDRNIATSLIAALEVESPAPEFRETLLGRLDAEFDRFVAPAVEPASVPGRAGGWRRSWKLAACAAGVLLAVSWAVTRPSYSWASMMEAVEQAGWLEVVVSPREDDRVVAWYSVAKRISAIIVGEEVRLDNHAIGRSYIVSGDANAIGEKPLDSQGGKSLDSRFVALLVSALVSDPSELDVAAEEFALEVKSESWARLPDGTIELRVCLVSTNEPTNELNLVFELDSETELPSRVQLLPTVDRQATEATFQFSESGPQDIYDLGVSTDWPIVPFDETGITPPSSEQTNNISKSTDEAAEESDTRLAAPSATIASVGSSPLDHFGKRLDAESARTVIGVDEMASQVNRLLADHWSEHSLTAVGEATDQEWMRRLYLDLTGRIPTVAEARRFLSDKDPGRREAVIEELLSSYDHASHLSAVWRSFLISDTSDLSELGGIESFEEWLTERFLDNQPYDTMVSELLLAEGRVRDGGPLLFFAAGKLRPEEIAKQASRAFLGVRMDCAQCHDHFYDDSWKQEDFWGFAAFFARMSQPKSRLERVSPVLRIRDDDRGEVMLPDQGIVVAPRFPHFGEPLVDDTAYSRREALGMWLTSPENPYLARATVNRIWSQLFGRGLVNPVDDMRSENRPVCPEVLDLLSTDFISSGYDLRRLYAILTRTEAYRLSSSSVDDNPERRKHFAQMNVKCFTAEQLYDCVSVATRIRSSAPGQGIARFNNSSRQAFLERFRSTGSDSTEYQGGITQALTLMNGPLMQSATGLDTGGLLQSLRAPLFDDSDRIDILFLATVSRFPTDEEQNVTFEYLNNAATDADRELIFSDLLWALLNSAEFTLIH